MKTWMIFRLLLFLAFLAAISQPARVLAQVNIGGDTISCGSAVTLSASVVNRPSTTSYTVAPISFAPESFINGTVVPLTDDGFTNPLPVGFPFCFFGQVYNQFHISANGWISFSPASAFQQVNNNPSAFPTTSNNVPKNVIAIWQDWNPPAGGTVSYFTTGTIPNRRLVVNWNEVPNYSCTNEKLKAQIILYEGSNVIEYHIAVKGSCPTWQGGNATQGIQNQSGNVAFTVPGRNSTVYALANDAYRFTPSGPPEPAMVKWFNITAGGPPVATGSTFTVNPSSITSYAAEVNYSCSPGVFRDTVTVSIDNTVISVTSTDASCSGLSDGTALVTTSGSIAPYTYSWSTTPVQVTPSISGLAKGTYYVEVQHGNCVFRDSAVISEPPPMSVATGMVQATCGDSNGIAFAISSGGEGPYSYSWDTGVVNDSILNVPAGTYNVNVLDNNGCRMAGQVIVTSYSNVNASFTASINSGVAPLQVTFTNTSSGAETYLWDFGNGTGSTNVDGVAVFHQSGSYTVTLNASHNSVCNDSYSIVITVLDSVVLEPVFIPNVLNVNSSVDANRTFTLRGDKLISGEIFIYNRWGHEVFQTSQLYPGWDGGEEPAGTYFYVITYSERGSDPVTVKGFLTLFR